MPLNDSRSDVRVNFIEYWEVSKDKTQHFSWVTDFRVTKYNVYTLMRGGRARWKIENETFNTLKNQGYHFEHNDGHGEQNLSVVLATLMMLRPLGALDVVLLAGNRETIRHVGAQSDQLQEITAVEWEIHDPLVFDNRARSGVFCVQQRSLG
jgi:hypothetical protein